LYKTNQKGSVIQKLANNLVKTEIPLTIFRAVDQIRLNDCRLKEWIFEDHYYKLDELLLDTNKNQLLSENMKNEEEKCLKDVK
jgi:hypothetical protein